MNHCEGDHCVTCSDEAVRVRVVRLLGDDLAEADVGGGRTEEVSVALVDVTVGDVILVHAKEAIGVVS
ncbi:MAG: hydrogenase assembly protein HupF [Streptosporangiaceae bacterium]|nr:hydrogenase assembly protein HupF [Streptosporangiaceae bacterium]